MIHGQQYHPHLNKPQPPPAPKPVPTKVALELMLKNGADMYDSVISLIERHSLPYTVTDTGIAGEGRFILVPTLSAGELFLESFITVDESTIQMKEDARKMAKTNYEVLIAGESGTGKELIAKSMIGDRKGQIKAVNCAGFPETLIESELFGHEKGSFTGAETSKKGLMAEASDGVMFLDEIGEMPMSVQAKLLRALQEKKIRRVGSNREEDINCKFVCATHRDLKRMVKEGTFRKDLYARISTLELDILPLIERKCDIIPITESLKDGKRFLEKYSKQLEEGLLDLSLNVRSLQQHVIRYNVLGRVILKT